MPAYAEVGDFSRFDTLSGELRWTLVDQSPSPEARVELENDPGGLCWTVYRVHGIQKVRGSNPLGSTKFLNTKLRSALPIVACATSLTAYLTAYLTP